jgi:hypothetical protein
MKKVLSVVLAAVMLACIAVPAFAEGGSYNVYFKAPSAGLITQSPEGQALGEAYYFQKTLEGKPCFVEDPNGIYYFAENDQQYHTREELIESTIPDDAPTYSPEIFAVNSQIAVTAGENLSFVVRTNYAYNQATVNVYINGQAATPNADGEYVALVDRDLTVEVREEALSLSTFKVVLTSGTGYSVKTLQGQNYKVVEYGKTFQFRVKVASGYSDADMKVTVTRGTSDLAAFLGDDADLLSKIDGRSETLVSDGVDSEGCRTYTIRNITSDCKVAVSGVREQKKADILTYLKRILKMILDVFKIDTSFLGLDDVIGLTYYRVNIHENVPAGTDLDYLMITGTTDPFKMNEFNVMSGDSVTIDFVTYDPNVRDRLRVTWKIGDREVAAYSNVWTAKLNRSTGQTYWSTTFMIDNINANADVNISLA